MSGEEIHYRSALTGEYVSEEFAKANPGTTVSETGPRTNSWIGGYGQHTCHPGCPCHKGGKPGPDFAGDGGYNATAPSEVIAGQGPVMIAEDLRDDDPASVACHAPGDFCPLECSGACEWNSGTGDAWPGVVEPGPVNSENPELDGDE